MCPPCAIPKGWNHSAQGCEERATLGPRHARLQPCKGCIKLLSMNTHAPIYGAEERHDEGAATLSGLMGLLFVSPRVARSSQPWAERCNPFGIEPRGLAPQKLAGRFRLIWQFRAGKVLVDQQIAL